MNKITKITHNVNMWHNCDSNDESIAIYGEGVYVRHSNIYDNRKLYEDRRYAAMFLKNVADEKSVKEARNQLWDQRSEALKQWADVINGIEISCQYHDDLMCDPKIDNTKNYDFNNAKLQKYWFDCYMVSLATYTHQYGDLYDMNTKRIVTITDKELVNWCDYCYIS